MTGDKAVCVFCCSEESYVVADYATMDHVEAEVVEETEGRSTLGRSGSGHQVSLRLLMSRNSEGKAEQLTLAAESRYCSLKLLFVIFFY